MKCLACGKSISKRHNLDRFSFTCSPKCSYDWRYNVHFIDTDWKIPALNSTHFVDLQFFKGGRLRGA